MRSTTRRRVWWIFSLARPFSCCFLFTYALFSLFFPNETDQTSTRKRRIFRHAILRLDARAVHGASRSDGAVRRHAQSRITVRPVVPFALSGLDSRENAFGAVSCGRRGKRGSGENRWEYRNRRTIITEPPRLFKTVIYFVVPFWMQSSSQRIHAHARTQKQQHPFRRRHVFSTLFVSSFFFPSSLLRRRSSFVSLDDDDDDDDDFSMRRVERKDRIGRRIFRPDATSYSGRFRRRRVRASPVQKR